MSKPINVLNNWFRTGKKPTQEQFWELIDSFWHKDLFIPMNRITGLDSTLQNKVDKSVYDTHLSNADAHTLYLAKKDASNLSSANILSWKAALGVGSLPANIATIDDPTNNIYGNVWSKEQSDALYMIADEFVLNGKIMASKIEALGLTELIIVTETSLIDFIANSANYEFQKNDIIAIPDVSGNYSLYIFKGGAKNLTENYIPIGMGSVTISMVQGLQAALDNKLNKPSTLGNFFISNLGNGSTYTAINPAANYLMFWDGSEFKGSNVYNDAGKLGIGTTTPTELVDLNGRLKAKGVVLYNNSEQLPGGITYFNRRFWGTDITEVARSFMYADFTDYKGLWESFSETQKNEMRTILNLSDGYKGFLKISANAPTNSGLYRLLEIGSYPNLTPAEDENGNAITITAIDGKINDAYFDGTTWFLSKVTIPDTTAKPVFDSTDNVNASTMKATYNGSDTIVKKALEHSGSIYAKFGWDANYALVASTTTMVCNSAYLTETGTIGKITIYAPAAGSFEIYKINAGAIPAIGNSLQKTFISTETLTAGLNVLNVNIPGVAGDMIAIKNLTGSVGYTDGGSHQYFDAAPATLLNFNSGYISYFFETVSQGSIQYPLDNLKKIVTISPTDFEEILEGTDKSVTIHSRVTLEGQSNALGVGFASGLAVAPYINASFDWVKAFSRVFIWNPKTNEYENIKIGVNNMASWDSAYTGGSPTNQPTFGPEIGFGLMWLQTHASGNLYIDKNVGDGQPISYFQKGGAYYTEKLLRKSKADKWLKDRGISVTELGFVWVQGEGDMLQTKNYYKAQLTTLINDRITDGFIGLKSKIVITQIPTNSANYGVGVADAKTDYVASNKMAVLVPYTSNFNADNIHLNTTGQINLGMKAAVNIMITDPLAFSDLQTKSFWTF